MPTKSQKTTKIVVNYDSRLQNLVSLGRFSCIDKNIRPSLFPPTTSCESGKKEIQTELVCFNRPIISIHAIKELQRMNLRPATIIELLVFVATIPEQQIFLPILAIGSRGWLSGKSQVPVVQSTFGHRRLRLLPWITQWRSKCSFLAVHQ